MKKSDIAMIVLIASVSVLIAFFVANSLFSGAANSSVKVKTIEQIDDSIVPPSTDIFNKEAINPTVPVTIETKKTD